MSRIRTTVTAGSEPLFEPVIDEPVEPAPAVTRKSSKPDAAPADVAEPNEETP